MLINIQVMTNIKEKLTRKLDNLSTEQLKSVEQYIDSLEEVPSIIQYSQNYQLPTRI